MYEHRRTERAPCAASARASRRGLKAIRVHAQLQPAHRVGDVYVIMYYNIVYNTNTLM